MSCDRLDTLVLIPLRAGSRGLPQKNLKELQGKPLYLHTVEQAIRVCGACVISTDIEELVTNKVPAGCTVIPRPSAIARDNTPMSAVVTHLLQTYDTFHGTVVLLQATSPLRSDKDLLESLNIFREKKPTLVMSVVENDSSVLKCGLLHNSKFVPLVDSKFSFMNRQRLPTVVKPNGAIYIFSADDYRLSGGFPTSDIECLVMPKSRSIDIDSQEDLNEVQGLFANELDG